MTESVVVTVNNLMSVDEEELAKAAEDGSTNRVVQSLETQLQFVNTSASNGTYEQVEDDLGVHVSVRWLPFWIWQKIKENVLDVN